MAPGRMSVFKRFAANKSSFLEEFGETPGTFENLLFLGAALENVR
jgi:hypothetical protein